MINIPSQSSSQHTSHSRRLEPESEGQQSKPNRHASADAKTHISSHRSLSETEYTPSTKDDTVTYEKTGSGGVGSPAGDRGDGVGSGAGNAANAAESSAALQGVDPLTDKSSETQVGASVVLAFIDLRLDSDAADGATAEALQSRLQAGLDGFLKGYNEAVQQLRDMGLFEGDVQIAVESMFNDVIGGISELADKYGLENPAADLALKELPEPPVASETSVTPPVAPATLLPADIGAEIRNTLNPEVASLQEMLKPSTDFYAAMAEKNQESRESRSYSFELRTRDGDLVTIQSQSRQSQSLNQQVGTGMYSESSSSGFQFEVTGELDAGELEAINNLLGQLNDVAETFFSGNIMDAFNKALDVGFDSEEIARYSINLTQSEYRKVETAYGAVSKDVGGSTYSGTEAGPKNSTMRLGIFVQQLQQINQHFVSLQLNTQIVDLAEFVATPEYSEDTQFGAFRPFMQTMLDALEKVSAQTAND